MREDQLQLLFDYQLFEQNPSLARVIAHTEKPGVFALTDEELDMVAGGGSNVGQAPEQVMWIGGAPGVGGTSGVTVIPGVAASPGIGGLPSGLFGNPSGGYAEGQNVGVVPNKAYLACSGLAPEQ